MSHKKGKLKELNDLLTKLAATSSLEDTFEYALKYMKTLIEESHFSLFLLKNNKLLMVSSTKIEPDDYDKCTYEIGEGFTGYVAKYGTILDIPDETDENYIRKKYNPAPQHAGIIKGKQVETESKGPYMAAPIMHDKKIYGVIRMSGTKAREQSKYTQSEKKLFESSAEKLSGILVSKLASRIHQYDNLITMIDKIGGATDEDCLYTEVTKDLALIFENGICSIYLLKEKNTVARNFQLKTTSSPDGENLLGTNYTENAVPLISEVVNNVETIKKRNVTVKELLSTKQVHFLGSPIKDENDKVIGVIEIRRNVDQFEFTETDKYFLSVLTNQVSLSIININRIKRINIINEGKRNEFKQIFSDVLIDMCYQLSNIDLSKDIKIFFENLDSSSKIENKILELEETILHNYRHLPSITKSISKIQKNFKIYEDLLFELPNYRDHFIHQFQVFLLGTIIIDKINNLASDYQLKNFSEYYNSSLNIPSDTRSPKGYDLANIAWFITSAYHDIAYPVERSEEIFNKLFTNMMGIDDKNILTKINLEKLCYEGGYGRQINQLCDLYTTIETKSADQWIYNTKQITDILIDESFRKYVYELILERRDHGVIGSLILIHNSDPGDDGYSTIIYPSALAIALHNDLFEKIKHKNTNSTIKFESNPLAFLLRYCDLIQDWGRGNSGTNSKISTLKCIDISYDQNIEAIVVKIEANYEGDREFKKAKIDEINNVFNMLSADDIVFEFWIPTCNYGKSTRDSVIQ